MKNDEKGVLNTSIEMLEEIYKYFKENNKENTQEFLDWLDKINEISVRN